MSSSTFVIHPRVSVERRPGGPVVVVHHRPASERAIRWGRVVAAVAVVLGVALVALILAGSRPTGLDTSHVGQLALAVLIPITGFVYLAILAWRRVEVTAAGEWLSIRHQPFSLGGRDLLLRQIDGLQVEVGRGYRIQFLHADGHGLLTLDNPLGGIATQDEATAMAASIARQFGFNFLPGVQPAVAPLPFPGEDRAVLTLPAATNQTLPAAAREGPMFMSPAHTPEETSGYIRAASSDEGVVVTYTQSWGHRGALVLFAAVWLGFATRSLGEDPVGTVFAGVQMLVGVSLLGAALSKQEIYLEEGNLVHRYRVLTIPIAAGRLPLANLERVGVVVAWDSYNQMFHQVVAQARQGDDLVVIKNLPEADGHVLCQALHKHLGVQI